MYIHRPHLRLSNYSEFFGARYTQWRYKQILQSDNTNYSAAGYDDSAWPIGQAPFGDLGSSFPDQTGDGSAPAYDPRFARNFATAWTVGSRLWMRRRIKLRDVPPGGFNCVSYIEDHCTFYVNGIAIFTSPSDVPGGAGREDTLSADKWHVGTNVIAVKCDDEIAAGSYTGSLTYADFLFEPIP